MLAMKYTQPITSTTIVPLETSSNGRSGRVGGYAEEPSFRQPHSRTAKLYSRISILFILCRVCLPRTNVMLATIIIVNIETMEERGGGIITCGSIPKLQT